MNLVNHHEILELLTHLDEHLEPCKAAESDYYKWSDGDQLRGIAHSMLSGYHAYSHIAAEDQLDIQVPRALLRIAARLDSIDEEAT